MLTFRLLLPATLLLLAFPSLLREDPADELRSPDPLKRLGAIEKIVAANEKGAEKLLVKALKDEDWEVVAAAAEGLGTVGGKGAITPLAKLCWSGPVGVIRNAAADSLASIDPAGGMKKLGSKLSGDTAIFACEALVRIAPAMDRPKVPNALKKLLKDKRTMVRAAGARAALVCDRENRAQRATTLFKSEYPAVVAGALEGAALDPQPEQMGPLLELLTRDELDDVLERRALRAVVATAGAFEEGDREYELFQRITQLSGATPARVAARGPRLAGEAVRAPWFDRPWVGAGMGPALEHDEVGVRAAAAWALRFGVPELLLTAHTLAESDPEPRVRLAALDSALELAGVAEDDEQRCWVIERLMKERDGAVREALIVALGEPGLKRVTSHLQEALEDPDWHIVACAAVSLGRTRSDDAVVPLRNLYASEDWRARGAAVVGLTHCLQKSGIPTLIEALGDAEPLVARTAHHYLLSIARGESLPPEVAAWQKWWSENETRMRLEDPKDIAERREKYGYSVPASKIFEGLDVMVLESRGDHVQEVLDEFEIDYRLTASSRIDTDGCDAAGVFVSNCTGEIEPSDVERLEWFVHVGGYLFGSCWAVHETIERIAPGAVRKLETRDEVLDQVVATPWAIDSPYLTGVFENGVQPIYHLVGAHLIEVLEPERVEVLIDSAESLEEWGGGNLACWFTVGHGVILDSVNHFDVQGLEEAVGLKTREDRMAYAVDHMGLSLAELRATREEKYWDSTNKASQEVRDLSVFKLVTNFVRLRRIEGR